MISDVKSPNELRNQNNARNQWSRPETQRPANLGGSWRAATD